MSDSEALLNSLIDALRQSPENIPLRVQVATLCLSNDRQEDAIRMLQEGLSAAPESEALKLKLAEAYLRAAKPSAAIVLLEEVVKRPQAPAQAWFELARAFVAEGKTTQASDAYRKAVQRDPALESEDLNELLGKPHAEPDGQFDPDDDDGEGFPGIDAAGRIRQTSADEMGISINMEKPTVNFDDVGGMDSVKQEIHMKIVAPLQNAELFKAYGKAIGGGVLLYGPPGCGKTHLARCTAGQIDATFIPVGIHDVLDMFIGNSERKLHQLFEYARSQTPCVLFFDEVDALGANRANMRNAGGAMIINQFLSELDGVQTNNDGLLILAATNAPWSLDSAFRRPGRFDRIVFVPPPDEGGRAEVLRVLLKEKPQEDLDLAKVAAKAKGFSGADLKGVVDQTIEAKLEEAMKTGVPGPIRTKDLLDAAKKARPSTKEWFATAKNYALYSNEGGAYDDILDYLKLR